MAGGIYDDWFIDGAIEGLRFRVDVTTDPNTTPADKGVYDKPTLDAYEADLWEYVDVLVVPLYKDTEIRECCASMGGVESGYLRAGAQRIGKDDLADYPVPDLIDEAMGRLRGAALESAIAGHRMDVSLEQERVEQLLMLESALAEQE